jgi:hypothetical protein
MIYIINAFMRLVPFLKLSLHLQYFANYCNINLWFILSFLGLDHLRLTHFLDLFFHLPLIFQYCISVDPQGDFLWTQTFLQNLYQHVDVILLPQQFLPCLVHSPILLLHRRVIEPVVAEIIQIKDALFSCLDFRSPFLNRLLLLKLALQVHLVNILEVVCKDFQTAQHERNFPQVA